MTANDLDPLMELYAAARAEGSTFDAGIEQALRLVLASPKFLFRVETPPAAAGGVAPVSDLELASRLSFFLWSSIPDEELLKLAEQGRLDEPAVLQAQVERMLKDPRSRALVDSFAAQWLRGNVEHFSGQTASVTRESMRRVTTPSRPRRRMPMGRMRRTPSQCRRTIRPRWM